MSRTYKLRRAIPLLLFLALAVLLGWGLQLEPDEPLPSPLLGKAAAEFELPLVDAPEQRFAPPRELRGQVWLLNVWASWCEPCRAEHPLLKDLAQEAGVALIGLNYKDAQGAEWLRQHGNPYRAALLDREGRVGMDYGVYGVPETFVIDRSGRVRLKHAGPLSAGVLEAKILPLVRSLREE